MNVTLAGVCVLIHEKKLMRVPLLLLVAFPLVEIFLLIKIGSQIGALATILWLITSIVLGVNILRYQGVTAMRKAMLQMQTNPTGEQPAQAIVDGLVKSIGAILLIIPGFATDFLAIFCFIPVLRRLLFKQWLVKVMAGGASFSATGFSRENYSGHIYEHQGSAKPTDDIHATGRILEHEPDKKD